MLRSGARMFAAQTQATSPKIHLTLRKAYGFGSMVMSLVGFDNQSATFAYPGATLGAMGASAMSRATGADADEAARAPRGGAAGVVPLGRERSASTSSSTHARRATCCSTRCTGRSPVARSRRNR